jgi:hypothetical protein
MEIKDVSFVEIPELLDAISKKYGNYISFCFSSGLERDGYRYFKWNVYTMILGHNDFVSHEGLVSFIENILHKEPVEYLRDRLESLRDRRGALVGEIEDVEREIREQEAHIKESDQDSLQQPKGSTPIDAPLVSTSSTLG